MGPNTSLTKEQAKHILPSQIKEELCKGTLIFFSDGLLLTQLGGGAAVLIQGHIDAHGYPMEAAFFSNSQMALECAALPKKKSAAQHLQTKLYTNLQHQARIFPIRLYWCPGHVGIPENKKVDKLAKVAAESQITSQHTINTMSLSTLRQASKEALKNTPPHP
ncbi:hypothetical protein O181_068030 [Austropuccinia psidii MF-1]|uniref:RNase H type-1 domain-containing protein n=1 Tax=Austropuccinia psidii MF-1 TaxID=1389203 RepID=A0A9Q3ERU8_9BASI|nr:hypothetical protein [Austropuccinia psidii MF-1]